MSDDLRALSAAARNWHNSYDHGSAGIELTDLVLQDRYAEQPPTSLPLRESIVTDLTYLLNVDAAARTAAGPVARGQYSADETEALRYAATRIQQLTNAGDQFPGGVDAGWPGDAATVLAEAARASEALAEIVTSTTALVAENLRKGALVALSTPQTAGQVPDQAGQAAAHERAAELISNGLSSAALQILELAVAIGALEHTSSSPALGARPTDGPTLADEAVLDCRLPGMSNTCRFHVRVFRPLRRQATRRHRRHGRQQLVLDHQLHRRSRRDRRRSPAPRRPARHRELGPALPSGQIQRQPSWRDGPGRVQSPLRQPPVAADPARRTSRT